MTNAVIFNCVYTSEARVVIGEVYHCRPSVVATENENTLESVTGNHLSGRSDADVQYIFLEKQNLARIPKNLESFFPNLLGIEWYNSNLKVLTANDLKPFPELKVFSAYKNNLVSFDADLFEFSPELRWISFYSNNIQHVGQDLLSQLSFLIYADFRSNPCINKLGSTPEAIEDLKSLLSAQCPPVEQTTTSETTTATEEPGDCPNKCVEQIESYGEEIMKLNDKITEQSDTISQLSKTVEKFEERFREIETRLRELSLSSVIVH